MIATLLLLLILLLLIWFSRILSSYMDDVIALNRARHAEKVAKDLKKFMDKVREERDKK